MTDPAQDGKSLHEICYKCLRRQLRINVIVRLTPRQVCWSDIMYSIGSAPRRLIQIFTDVSISLEMIFFFLSFSKQASFHNHSHVLQLCVISRASCQGALRVTQTLSVLCRKSSCHWRMNLFIFNSYKSQLTLRQLMIIIRVFVPRHHQCLCVMLFHSPIAPTNCWLHAL